MATRISIIRSWDDHEPVVLGTILKPAAYSVAETAQHVEELWEKFKKTDPNSDSEFMDVLKKEGYTVAEEDESEVILQ